LILLASFERSVLSRFFGILLALLDRLSCAAGVFPAHTF
jgi:hypothetical protein